MCLSVLRPSMSRPRRICLLLPTLLGVVGLGACGGSEPSSNRVTVKLPKANAATPANQIRPEPSQADEPVAPAQTETDLPPLRPEAAASRYTSLGPSGCVPAGEDNEANVDRRRCAGAAGYALETGGTELRRELTVIAPGGSRSSLGLSQRVPPGSLGTTAEWRGAGHPRALILRVNGSQNAGARISDLIVVKLGDQPCIAAVVPRGPDQNVKARVLADRGSLECLGG